MSLMTHVRYAHEVQSKDIRDSSSYKIMVKIVLNLAGLTFPKRRESEQKKLKQSTYFGSKYLMTHMRSNLNSSSYKIVGLSQI